MKIRFITLILFIGAVVSAQENRNALKDAETQFLQHRYAEALPQLIEQLNNSSSDASILYKAGICYLHSRSQKHKAPEFLEKAIQNSTSFYTKGYAKETDAPLDVYLYLGDAYHVNYDFDKAIESYSKYKEMLKSSKIRDPEKYAETDNRIAASAFAKELKTTVGFPPNLKLKNLGGGESVGEQSSQLSPDKTTMIYTLKIPVSKLSRHDDEKYFTAITPEPEKAVVKYSKPQKKKNDNTPDTIVNICTVGTSVDGQVLLTYHNDKGECNLYVIRLKNNKWTTPVKLPKTANEKGWEPGEHISADGRYLFFSSDRPGGYGGKDIYRCEKLKNGEWSKAENMGPQINTPYDEEAPFLHADGKSLYFSSNRFKPATSFDILMSKASGKDWEKPLVVGYPINSSDDDIFYQVSEKKKKMLASASTTTMSREDMNPGPTKKLVTGKKENNDNAEANGAESKTGYLMSFENQAKASLTLLSGEVLHRQKKTTSAIAAGITVIDLRKEEQAGKFYSEKGTGEYTFLLPSGRNVGIWYEAPGYLFVSENQHIQPDKTYFEKRKPVEMKLVEEGATTVLNNIFFQEGGKKILPESNSEIDRIYELLKNNPSLKIRIRNYIYSKDKTLKSLSSERAEELAKVLEEKGIDKKRLKSKGYRKSEVPGTNKKKGPLKPEDLKPVQQTELEITEV